MGNPKIAHQELFERMNYLYQAANVVLFSNPHNSKVTNIYSQVMTTIAKRAVLKLDPSIKRTLCKKCNALLVPGVTSTVRFHKKLRSHLVITCLQCKTKKRFPCKSGYSLWSEKQEAIEIGGEETTEPIKPELKLDPLIKENTSTSEVNL